MALGSEAVFEKENGTIQVQMKKYLTHVFTIDHKRYDTDTYNLLFEKIQKIEEQLTIKNERITLDEWEYQEILKRERRGNSSVYYVLFKKIK